MLGLIRDPGPDHPSVATLRRRLNEFYSTTTTYLAFRKVQDRSELYAAISPLLPVGRTARVLELGAGLTGFPTYLKRTGATVAFTAQDVTPANQQYLTATCDEVVIGDVESVSGKFDLLLSTYVFEHVATPRHFLEQVDRLLVPGGWHVLICPRYDVPGYVCPSVRHRGRAWRVAHTLLLSASRARAIFDRKPRFWINPDPAVLHGPWYRDADAVHLVSYWDVAAWHRAKGYAVSALGRPTGGFLASLRQRLLTVTLACQKLE